MPILVLGKGWRICHEESELVSTNHDSTAGAYAGDNIVVAAMSYRRRQPRNRFVE